MRPVQRKLFQFLLGQTCSFLEIPVGDRFERTSQPIRRQRIRPIHSSQQRNQRCRWAAAPDFSTTGTAAACPAPSFSTFKIVRIWVSTSSARTAMDGKIHTNMKHAADPTTVLFMHALPSIRLYDADPPPSARSAREVRKRRSLSDKNYVCAKSLSIKPFCPPEWMSIVDSRRRAANHCRSPGSASVQRRRLAPRDAISTCGFGRELSRTEREGYTSFCRRAHLQNAVPSFHCSRFQHRIASSR